MQNFVCAQCGQVLFFENSVCAGCGHQLAYLPEVATLSTIIAETPIAVGFPLRQAGMTYFAADGTRHKLCGNDTEYAVCNWAIPADSTETFCRSCRLNQTIPNLGAPGSIDDWRRLEAAKRRLLHTLLEYRLPLDGLAFRFLADQGAEKVLTGHKNGLITINLAESNDVLRERMRVEMGEAYRTLLGHFRHEAGHFFWDKLIGRSVWHDRYRELFGDESASYSDALERHHRQGPPIDWRTFFVTSYASSHPWEDWAETFAHYLHMVDTLETARAFGIAMRGAPALSAQPNERGFQQFALLIEAWVPVTVALNSLNRSMGLADAYPFVLSPATVEKLRFVHDVIQSV